MLGIGNRRTTLGITTFFVQMGQFIDHDLTLTPEESEPECCKQNRDGELWLFNENYDEDRCIPIRGDVLRSVCPDVRLVQQQ